MNRFPVPSPARHLSRIALLLVITAQLADLATFGIAARLMGPAGELGPLRFVYSAGGFDAVAATKLAAVGAMLTILALYERLVGSPRHLALLVSVAGVLGAATNVLAIAGVAGSRAGIWF
jgi:hypothetical protein